MGVDETQFALDGGYEYAGEDDFEPQVVEDLDRQALDAQAQEIYGVESWEQVEQLWAQQDAERAAAAHDAQIAQLAERYGNERMADLSRTAFDEAGKPDIHLPHVEPLAKQLLNDKDWQRRHDTLAGEAVIAAAVRDAVKALSPAQNETDALERYLLKKGG
jgi:hypothetical protein